MKAAVLTEAREVACEELPVPAPAPGEVLVRVAYCGVCGSDIVRYRDGQVHAFPLVLGHEFSGVVEQVGKGADPALVGRKVAGIPLVPCMECADCKAGNYSLCSGYSFIGSRQPGAFAQYVAVPEANVLPLADDADLLQAAFFEPATVALHAIGLASPQPSVAVAVLGCGTIGIFLAQALQARGLDVTAFVRGEARAKAAKAAAVDNVAFTTEEGWEARAKGHAAGNGFGCVFDTSGNGALVASALELAANKATVCMVGTPKRPLEFSVAQWENINRKELSLKGSWMSYSAPFPGAEWSEAARLFAEGKLFVAKEMVDAVYPLDDIAQGLERLSSPGGVSGKLLVDCR